MKISLCIALLLCVCPLWAQEEDAPDCKDSPLIQRMPGSVLKSCDHKEFDEVHFSDYQTRPEAVVSLRAMPLKLSVYPAGQDARNFESRARRGSGKPCFRGESDTVAYADGKFFPCCVSPGLDHTQGLEPCEGWQEKVQLLDMGCAECFFSPA